MSRSDRAFYALMGMFLLVIGVLTGIIVAGSVAQKHETTIEILCVELDNAGSDSTDPVILEACQP